jgi:hypothetical protein
MARALELTGQKFGRLTVENLNPVRTLSGSTRWNCICDCENKVTVIGSHLISGHTTSCGCFKIELSVKKCTTHGMSNTSEYNIYNLMIRRCTDSSVDSYIYYGGRGITVCDRWMNSFEAFYEDMGPRPSPDHSLDRKENDKGYYKDNCRWSTIVEQANNRRNNVFHDYKDQQLSLQQLADLPETKKNGICIGTLKSRINQYNYSAEEAVNTPLKNKI